MPHGFAPEPSEPKGWFGLLRSRLRTGWSEIVAPQKAVSMPAGAPAEATGGSARLLVVDDDPESLRVISALLESRGLLPLLAADGAEAVALACEMDFDLILMDLQMPILDGLSATVAIRRFETRSARPAVPVVAYSSANLGDGLLADHGMNGRLTKPCDDRDLEDCLVRWCPTYRPAQSVRGAAFDQPSWQSEIRRPGANGASLR